MAQSDTGMWMTVSGLIAYGLASERTWLYAPLLVLSPWVRPEGEWEVYWRKRMDLNQSAMLNFKAPEVR